MKEIGHIYLVWRPRKGERRQIVGIIRRNSTEGTRFKYTITEKKAQEMGFVPYTDFPKLTIEYTENVLDIFGQRLTKSDRGDIQKYYDFWEVDPNFKDDKFYLLAHTQGLLATDNFEFLADFSPSKDLSFTSEICGLSHNKISPDAIEEGDELRWEFEANNKYDSSAIKVFKKDIFLGYVKMAHSKVFYKKGGKNLKIKVKNIGKNGYLNEVFIKVYNP